jgi:protease PrsW
METGEQGLKLPKRKKKYGNWLRMLLIGLITYFLGIVVLAITGNPNLFPSIVLLGNFLVPVTYVAFFYEKRNLSRVRLSDTAASFFYGGFLGTFFAAILEPIFIHTLNFETAIIVGIIEEFAKILGVLLILSHRRHEVTMDGIILGAAAGMGFAALESSGYAFTSFLRSGGSLSDTVYITLLRGILSPFGHGTWTAILAGVLLKESAPKYFKFSTKVFGAYLLVVILHGLWDGLPSLMSIFLPSSVAVVIGELIVGITGVLILSILWYYAKKQVKLKANT